MKERKTFPIFSENLLNGALTFFFAVLFFLCFADQTFSSRFMGFNIRWGQFLLFACALFSGWITLARPSRDPERLFLQKLLKIWAVFFFFYAMAAAASDFPRLTYLKWGWGLFNIAGAALLCLQSSWSQVLRRGFEWAVVGLALIIWTSALVIFCFHLPFPTGYDHASYPLIVNLPWVPYSPIIGYVQTSYSWMGTVFVRPTAFYYEASYAGCALSFALPLLLALSPDSKKVYSAWKPALVLSAIWLVGSRSGVFGSLLCLTGLGTFAFLKHRAEMKTRILKTLLAAGLLILVFLVSEESRKYMHFLYLGNLSPKNTIQRIADPHSSEGGRVRNSVNTFQRCLENPFLGNGVNPASVTSGHQLAQPNLNTWLEIILEAGLLGLLGFLFSVGSTLWEVWKVGGKSKLAAWIAAAWIVHFAVNLNLTQTFPRLDYWLFFFLSIQLLVSPLPKTTSRRR